MVGAAFRMLGSRPRPGTSLTLETKLSMTFYETDLVRMQRMADYDFAAVRRLKFELLGWGLVATDRAWEEVRHVGKFPQQVRSGASCGLDVVLPGGAWVNAPVYEREAEPRAPLLELVDGKFSIAGREITVPTEVAPRPAYYDVPTSGGMPMRLAGQMSGDRIGFGLTNGCYYWKEERRCKFCSIGLNTENEKPDKSIELILETLEVAVEDPALPARHVLLSGGTPPGPDRGARRFAAVCREIKKRFPLRVYVMTVPPEDPGDLAALFDAGVDELALNLEVYDEELSAAIVPGKHREIGRRQYLEALGFCRTLWEAPDVRSLLVAGIEPVASTLTGVRLLADQGVTPILSVFRPLAGTMLARHPKPHPDELEELYLGAQEACEERGLTLGPSCPGCQNNTATFALAPILAS